VRIQRIDKRARTTKPPKGAGGPSHASVQSGPAARPDARRVNPSSYVALSLLFSALLFGLFLVGDRGFLQVRRQRRDLATLHGEVSSLAAENERLEQEVVALKNDPRAVEKIAREDLQLVKPGEVVLILPPGWKDRVRPKSTPPGNRDVAVPATTDPHAAASTTSAAGADQTEEPATESSPAPSSSAAPPASSSRNPPG